MEYAGLKTVCWFLRLLPYRAARAVGRFSTGLAARFAPKRFERNLQDIARVFPEKSPQEVYEIAYNSWRNMGQILAEFVKLSSYSPE